MTCLDDTLMADDEKQPTAWIARQAITNARAPDASQIEMGNFCRWEFGSRSKALVTLDRAQHHLSGYLIWNSS